jgi:hypothetical protein
MCVTAACMRNFFGSQTVPSVVSLCFGFHAMHAWAAEEKRARRQDLWRRARCHVGVTTSGLCQRSRYLGAIAYSAELCYLGAIGLAPSKGSKNDIKFS